MYAIVHVHDGYWQRTRQLARNAIRNAFTVTAGALFCLSRDREYSPHRQGAQRQVLPDINAPRVASVGMAGMDRLAADLKDGVLTLSVPKASPKVAEAKKVKITKA